MVKREKMPSVNEKVLSFYNRLAKKYDSKYGKNTIWQIPYNIFLPILSSKLKKGWRILDCGGGTGKWAIPLAKRGFDVTITDISKNMIDIAKNKAKCEKVHIKAILENIEDMFQFKNSSFNAALCMGDILSYSNYYKGLVEIARILKPKGLIAGSVDSRLGYLDVFRKKPSKFDVKKLVRFLKNGDVVGSDGFPLHAFLPNELEEVLQKSGFGTIEIYALPFISSFFWDDQNFLNLFGKKKFIAQMIKIESKFIYDFKNISIGHHHLYFIARKK